MKADQILAKLGYDVSTEHVYDREQKPTHVRLRVELQMTCGDKKLPGPTLCEVYPFEVWTNMPWNIAHSINASLLGSIRLAKGLKVTDGKA